MAATDSSDGTERHAERTGDRRRRLAAQGQYMQDSSAFRICHIPSGLTLAEGRRGWDITPFDGTYYIRST